MFRGVGMCFMFWGFEMGFCVPSCVLLKYLSIMFTLIRLEGCIGRLGTVGSRNRNR